METNDSSSEIRIRVTPCALRPVCAICPTGVRTSVPASEISTISSASVTANACTSSPLRAVVLMAIMPLPPRPLTGKSETGVRLPKPRSQAHKISPCCGATTNDTTRLTATTLSLSWSSWLSSSSSASSSSIP